MFERADVCSAQLFVGMMNRANNIWCSCFVTDKFILGTSSFVFLSLFAHEVFRHPSSQFGHLRRPTAHLPILFPQLSACDMCFPSFHVMSVTFSLSSSIYSLQLCSLELSLHLILLCFSVLGASSPLSRKISPNPTFALFLLFLSILIVSVFFYFPSFSFNFNSSHSFGEFP